MNLHPAYNKTEIAERYYKRLGTFTTREQAKKNFHALKHPDKFIIYEVLHEIHEEQIKTL